MLFVAEKILVNAFSVFHVRIAIKLQKTLIYIMMVVWIVMKIIIKPPPRKSAHLVFGAVENAVNPRDDTVEMKFEFGYRIVLTMPRHIILNFSVVAFIVRNPRQSGVQNRLPFHVTFDVSLPFLQMRTA